MPCNASTPLSQLPGDPSLVVYTNVDLGDKKDAFMIAASGAIAQCLGKPETYVSVCVMVRSPSWLSVPIVGLPPHMNSVLCTLHAPTCAVLSTWGCLCHLH